MSRQPTEQSELPPDIQERITALAARADDAEAKGDFLLGKNLLLEAFALLPDSKYEWAAGEILLCGAAGLWALRRYLYLLTHAEAVAHQADCPSCDTYARFKIVHAHSEGTVVSVRCNQCAHEWTIES